MATSFFLKIKKNNKGQIKLQLKSYSNKLEFFQIFFFNILLHNLYPYATLKFYLFLKRQEIKIL
jgi:hypothetical protein